MLNDGEISNGDKIVIPIAVLDELQSQASSNKEHGISGLLELKKIREKCEEVHVIIQFVG